MEMGSGSLPVQTLSTVYLFIPSEMFSFPSGMFDCVFVWFKVISVESFDVVALLNGNTI